MPANIPGDAARIILDVPRGGERSVLLVGDGLFPTLPALLADYAPAHRYAVISDSRVSELHGRSLLERLADAGMAADLFTFPAGEAHKTAATWARLLEQLAAAGLGRDGCVVAVGGGVTGDLSGFVASTFARGLPLVQVPTSLLAMIDASIGGKTGIDLEAGKNLAGTFHQPRLVVADPALLRTLPMPELRGGLAEAVKHGAIADASYLERIRNDSEAILDRDIPALQRLIVDSVRTKARFVAEDVREAGARALLNFGHTLGHAIERVTRYQVSHGQAVAVGMVLEALLGEEVGVTAPGTTDRLAGLLRRLGLPARLAETEPPSGSLTDDLLAATRTDKKARAGRVRYVLLSELGKPARADDGAWTHAVPEAAVRAALGRAGEVGSAESPKV